MFKMLYEKYFPKRRQLTSVLSPKQLDELLDALTKKQAGYITNFCRKHLDTKIQNKKIIFEIESAEDDTRINRMLKNISFWTLVCILPLLLSIAVLPMIVTINSPVDSFEDVFKTMGYGLVFSAFIITPIFYTLKFLFPKFITNVQTWTSLGIKIKFHNNRKMTLRKLLSTFSFIGIVGLLAVIPLYINEHYATAPLNNFYATVSEKKIQHKRGGGDSYTLKIKSEAGIDSNIGSLSNIYDKLELGDVIKLVTRKGVLGINFYVAIYKNDRIIYPS